MTRPVLGAPLRAMVLAGGLIAGMAAAAQAQDYPSKPVRIIVPFAPGGSADVFGRFLAQRLQESIWLGLMAPRGAPLAVINKLNAEVGKVTANPEVRRAWTAQGTTAMTMDVDEFTRYVSSDIAKWAHIVKISGAKAE